MEICVTNGSVGWNGTASAELPEFWNGYVISHLSNSGDSGSGSGSGDEGLGGGSSGGGSVVVDARYDLADDVADRAIANVEIDGDAYFEVAHNPEAPFVVYTRTLNTIVKGTSFNIYSTSDTSATHYVVLVEGSVEVDMPTIGQSVTLAPSQIISYNNDSYLTTNTDVSRYIGWHDGALTVDSDSVADVVAKLAEYYGVEAECDNDVSSLSCSGRLVLFDDINQTLTVLESIIPIKYKWNSGKLYISLER
jgi:ferric-dicitrate binding protein FerR (iron transport regulator)